MENSNLPALVEQAANRLASAKTYAEILEAKVGADATYELAKKATTLARKFEAHTHLVEAARRVQGDALLILKGASVRLADEYDAAQERGEVQKHGGQGRRDVASQDIPSLPELRLTRQEIHDARQVRDAEKIEPDLVRKTINRLIEDGQDPTKGEIKKVVRLVLNKPVTNREERADPSYFAMSEVAFACGKIVNCAERHGPHEVIQGFRNERERSANIALIKRTIKYLESVLSENEHHGNAEENATRRRQDKVVDLAVVRKT